MPLSQHPGLSEEDVEAAELLDVLRNSHGQRGLSQNKTVDAKRDTRGVSPDRTLQLAQPSLLDRVRKNTVINNVVSLYEMNSKKRAASAVNSSGRAQSIEGAAIDDCNHFEENEEQHISEAGISKRQKLTKAIAKSKGNLKEYQLNMSIGSKKRLIACLHLLKLANKQLTNRVSYLQQQVEFERESKKVIRRNKAPERKTEHEKSGEDDDSDDEFFDAAESVDEQSAVIKMEVVGTVKKVYSLISKFAGNSLPEPARSQVRQTLLNLPTNWTISVNKSSQSSLSPKTHRRRKQLSANGKVLILAEESLTVVRNVMNVVDCTLGKAEEWVKQKQEVKELLKERFIHQQLKKQIREQLEKENHEAEN